MKNIDIDSKMKEIQQSLEIKTQQFNQLSNQREEVAKELLILQGKFEMLQELCQHSKK